MQDINLSETAQNTHYKRLYEEFLAQYPDYLSTVHIDDLRKSNYSRLDAENHIYLDYTGSGLYAENQLDIHSSILRENILGNPHSYNPSSGKMTEILDDTRNYLLKYFNASPDEYEGIFTLNASGGLKLIGESYPFNEDAHYLLTFDNHNSVNGIREYARGRGAGFTYLPLSLPEMRVGDEMVMEKLDNGSTAPNKLFAYPAQSNYSGIQHPLEWVEFAQERGWDVILDAAAFVPTNRLDLSKVKPQFVPVSFYKMFGYPTGVGCLIARKDSLAKLTRPWFAGGTITVASVRGDRYYFTEGAAAFEDGTPNFLSIPAVKIGLQHIESVGIDSINLRVKSLTDWLIRSLLDIKHSNGSYLIKIYGSSDIDMHGGVVTLNFFDREGDYIDHMIVEEEASKKNISLRTGCFCNPGAGEAALGLTREELSACFDDTESRLSVEDFRRCIDGKSTGAVRVSLGIVSDFKDVYSFYKFAGSFVT